MIKVCWHFTTELGKGGTFTNPFAIDAEEALRECRLSLGSQVIMVY